MTTTARRPLPTGLARFLAAQSHNGAYRRALGEIRRCDKQSHWMWFVFPQHVGLAKSETARYFGIAGAAEATAYLADPVLRARLAECTSLVLRQRELMFGRVDTYKLRSCMTLFSQVADDPTMLNQVLEKHFTGPDQLTLDLLAGKTITLPQSRPVYAYPRPAVGRHRQEGVHRAQEALAAAERRRQAQQPWTRNRVETFVSSFGLSTVAARQLTDAWMADRQGAMKQAWEAAMDSFADNQ